MREPLREPHVASYIFKALHGARQNAVRLRLIGSQLITAQFVLSPQEMVKTHMDLSVLRSPPLSHTDTHTASPHPECLSVHRKLEESLEIF